MASLRAQFGLAPRLSGQLLWHSDQRCFSCSAALMRHQKAALLASCNAIASRSLSTENGAGRPRLRFAPSPTGNLHLGGLRTALLNHLYARSTGGSWVLRIEDTDQNRFVPGSIEALQDALQWAGLKWDEGPSKGGKFGPYIQSKRLETYRDWAQRLIDQGDAYYDFRPAADRSALAAGASVRRTVREKYTPPDEEQARDMMRDGKAYSIRLKFAPQSVEHHDLVFGKMTFPPDHDAEDPVLLKQDGCPTYHLASVIDDHLMQITHVFRGEEWLPSLPKHLVLYKALGLQPPQFAHLPLLMNEDGSKLSKRSGHASVDDYRKMGYEPEALVNFIALMGYNHHGEQRNGQEGEQHETDVMSMKDFIQSFDISRISQSRAVLNLPKLDFLNRHHLRARIEAKSTPAHQDLLDRLRGGLQEKYHLKPDEVTDAQLRSILHLISDRANTLPQIVEGAKVVFTLPDWSTSTAVKMRKSVPDDTYRTAVRLTIEALASRDDNVAACASAIASMLDDVGAQLLHNLSSDHIGEGGAAAAAGGTAPGKGKGTLMKPLRHALTGERAGPTVPDLVATLGKQASLERLRAALGHDGRLAA
ncbi:glutamyl-tRNA synthetase [Tilletiaria anomala UBC 951]|uniref:Glutamate--tRNA ligase, mitochondrial n=1 Tax=Tilletiaria anomala (strain ATCC 24038 / CBS 436.72 / UBC 951) TaxID=1037660 RepID=A0A066WIA4_TILAU|nr:glutamyl-tRNA synthetase [Tilletiaria anomala UBC 951]KDN50400.1 glutamyl-tRNA synthetase [Tilletiaria anomala UBC 951]